MIGGRQEGKAARLLWLRFLLATAPHPPSALMLKPVLSILSVSRAAAVELPGNRDFGGLEKKDVFRAFFVFHQDFHDHPCDVAPAQRLACPREQNDGKKSKHDTPRESVAMEARKEGKQEDRGGGHAAIEAKRPEETE